MKSVFNYIVSPVKSRYNNKKSISTDDGDKEIILNTEIFNHHSVSRNAIVVSVPTQVQGDISVGDEVVIHHNIFRRWHDVRGVERDSSSFISEDMYTCSVDQMYLHKKDNEWRALSGYSFIQPVESNDNFSMDKEKPLMGFIKYLPLDYPDDVSIGDLVGFTPNSEFEFVIDGVRMYRVLTRDICINYGNYGREEKAYNPSWAKGS